MNLLLMRTMACEKLFLCSVYIYISGSMLVLSVSVSVFCVYIYQGVCLYSLYQFLCSVYIYIREYICTLYQF